jgi:hypothetical protein
MVTCLCNKKEEGLHIMPDFFYTKEWIKMAFPLNQWDFKL